MPILSFKWYGYVCLGMVVINNCACVVSPRLRTIIQVILISILYVLARMVFSQAHLLNKKKINKKKKQVGQYLVPTYKIFVAFSLCTSKTSWKQNALKNKGKNARTTIELHYARKRPQIKNLTIPKWHNF